MTKIVGISGSLRKASFNTGLLRAAAEVMPEGATLEVHTIAGIPLYNADEEAESGIPPAVTALKEAMMSADGVLLVTPEYNNSMPGPFKNAIDWTSRPSEDIGKVFGGRPFAIMGASPGGFGTVLAQNAWLATLRTLGTEPWFGARMLVSRAGSVFTPEGELHDEAVREQLRRFMAGYVEYIRGRG